MEKLTIFPKLKQKLLFLREQEKLFKNKDDNSTAIIDPSPSSTSNSSISYNLESKINSSTNHSMNDPMLEKVSTKREINLSFPDEYINPTLPNTLLEDIDAGAIHKFAPHHTNRQVLIYTIAHDLIKNFNLFYPTHKQFDNIGEAIVRKLKLPLTKDNVIMLINYDDDTLADIKTKANKLRDDPPIDLDIRLQLWKETVHVRRKAIRNQATSEILQEFPGYKDPSCLFSQEAPSTPYPAMVFDDNVIYIYLDFLLIVSTTSPDDGLALLLAIYLIFELNFSKNNRSIRFLYSIIFGDIRFISNKMRNLIKEKNIEISIEQNRKLLDNTNLFSNSHTTVNNDSQSSQSKVNINASCIILPEDLSSLNHNNLNVNTATDSMRSIPTTDTKLRDCFDHWRQSNGNQVIFSSMVPVLVIQSDYNIQIESKFKANTSITSMYGSPIVSANHTTKLKSGNIFINRYNFSHPVASQPSNQI
ncbi:unnamed protein product [Rotaria magnacalcarata]|uniref:Uncharacterized protein n=3 Tax=Rotaria magnacalcarata TaxID=392030 RepID=A0A8S2LIL8_9BILA|nr:unnamed protein product [Rotaria magnacalcarata]CAF3910432.1 unnamed protein product [Rotaria magnacalcarata]